MAKDNKKEMKNALDSIRVGCDALERGLNNNWTYDDMFESYRYLQKQVQRFETTFFKGRT